MTQTTGDTGAIDGIDHANVTAWFAEHVPDAVAPLSFALIAGGHSNLTYGVTDSEDARWVLRRPPLGHVLATAHDMSREHKIMSALGPTNVPVPPMAGLCTDDSVNGAPFYVMRFVDGHIVRDKNTALEALDETARRRAGESIADVLADIHAVDVDAVGLGDLGKKEGYVSRQLKRWYSQFQASNELTGRPAPLVHEVHGALAARIPEQGPAAIVHGDYRLDNCIVDDKGQVAAVLDWELCTLGDPLADLGLLLVYWTQQGDAAQALLAAPTAVEGFPSRDEVVARYAARSGRDISSVDFFVAFGYWKLACILEGVYARYSKGAMGKASGFEGFERQVNDLAQLAADRVAKLRVTQLFELVERPDLESPVLVLALDGWIDAGMGAAGARASLLDALETVTVATFDSDMLLDHRARRPTMHLEDGVMTGLTWPTIELLAASDNDGNDFLLLAGAEPDHTWRAFSRAAVDLALEFGVRMVVGIGAYPAPVPHTRPARLAVSASDASLASIAPVHTTVDVPAGVQAAIERRAHEVGLPAVGLWAQVPHYVAAMPYPGASAALIEALGTVASLRFDTLRLLEEAASTRRRIDVLVADNEEHLAMVRQLEASYDADEHTSEGDMGAGPLPSGDELAAELERFLRDQ